MKPEEAITDLSIQREVKRRLGKTREAQSIGLGIEALEREQARREGRQISAEELLPSETE